jgi:uncharacterized membrane protein YuzA (DUF378 family)
MRTITWVLVVAAAIRLGIIGFFNFDFIGSFFGSSPIAMSWVDRVISGIVGIAGIYGIFLYARETQNNVA